MEEGRRPSYFCHEIIDFRREEYGGHSWKSRDVGKLPYNSNTHGSNSELLFEVWRTARTLAEKTRQDVAVYVINGRVVPQARTVKRKDFF